MEQHWPPAPAFCLRPGRNWRPNPAPMPNTCDWTQPTRSPDRLYVALSPPRWIAQPLAASSGAGARRTRSGRTTRAGRGERAQCLMQCLILRFELDEGRRPDAGRIAAVPCRRTIISELWRPDRGTKVREEKVLVLAPPPSTLPDRSAGGTRSRRGADRTFACAFDLDATRTVDPGSQSALAGGQPTFFTGGIFHEPSRIVGSVSLGQYRRNINWNLPAGAGNQFDSLSGPGDSF
jgi:hypothetical protein